MNQLGSLAGSLSQNQGGCVPKRSGEVHLALDTLEKQTAELRELVCQLRSRIDPVLRAVPATPCTGQPVGLEGSCIPLVGRVLSIKEIAKDTSYLVSDILERLEV